MRKSKLPTSSLGLTLIELMLVVSILAILIGFITINLTSAQHKASISTTVQTVIADLNSQKIKAMVGDIESGTNAGPYGIHFDASQYVLFYSSTYSPLDPRNFEVLLSENLEFTTLTDVVFSQIEGELPLSTAITLRDKNNGEEKTIQLNRYGVVTAVN